MMEKTNRQKPFRERQYTVWAVLCVAVLILCLIPLFYISRYDYASADDYSFAFSMKEVWEQTHSIPALVLEDVKNTVENWRGWQGIYFATFLMIMNPLLLGEEWYGVGACFALAAFVLSIFYFIRALTKNVLKSHPRSLACMISAIIALLLLQKVPSPVEAFYWWPGAAYILCVSLVLVNLGNTAKLLQKESGGGLGQVLLYSLLGFLAGGSNLNIGIVHVEILALCTAAAFWCRRPARRAMAAVFLVSLGGFLLAALAPGNFGRRSGGPGLGMVEAVLGSFVRIFGRLRSWLSVELLLCMLFLLPAFCAFPVARAFIRKPHQLVCIALLCGALGYCLTASGCAVVLYGVSYFPGRAWNPIYICFVFMMFGLEWVITQCVRGGVRYGKGEPSQPAADAWYARWLTPYLLCVALAAGLLVSSYILTQNHERMHTLTAIVSLREGEAQAYGAEHQDRVRRLENCTVDDLRVPVIWRQPKLLYFSDIFGPNDWRNKAVAQYYGIPIVHLI